MKLLLFMPILFLSATASADAINFTCLSNPAMNTLTVFTTGSDVNVRVIHDNGTDGMPISTGDVTPGDLPALTAKAKALAGLGAQYDLQIPSSSCKTAVPDLVDCHGPINATINGHKVTWLSMANSKSTTVSLLYPQPLQQTVINFLITVDGTDYAFQMTFDSSECTGAGSEAIARKN